MKKSKLINILITGGAGYIGSCLTQILKKKFNIYIIDNLSYGKKSQIKNNKFYQIDLLSKKKLEVFFKKKKIDLIIHLAAYTNLRLSFKNSDKFYKNNYLATKNLVNISQKYGVKKIIFSSTASVYGKKKIFPISEKSTTKPISHYGKSKLKAENFLIKKSSKNFSCIILRFFNVAGAIPNKNLGEIKNPAEHFIPIAIRKVLNKEYVPIFKGFITKDKTGIRDYIHVTDVCRAITMLIDFLYKVKNKKNFFIFNIGSNKCYSTLDVLKIISQLLKIKPLLLFLKKKIGEPSKLLTENYEIYKCIKWKPLKNIRQIIYDSIVWEKKILYKKISIL